MGIIILVTGTPGVGKSKLARALAKRGSRLVELSLLVRKRKLYTSFDKRRKSFVMDNTKVRKQLESLANHSEELVIASHTVGKFLPKKLVRRTFVLRLDPVILYKRLRKRGWTRDKAWENTEAEILDTSLQEALTFLGKRRVFEIDTTKKSTQQVCNEALKALSRPEAGRIGQVNWLARYDPVELERKI